jgi:hypothetical protein
MLINAYCTVRELPPLDFPGKLVAQRDRSDPEMLTHLDGFLGYLFPDGAQMTGGLYALMRHIQRVAHQLSLEVDESAVEAFGRWLERANGVAFLPDGSVRDSLGRTLFHPEAPADDAACLPVSAKALQRRASNLRRLEAEGISVPSDLPAIISEDEVEPRAPRDVALRALALFLVAVRAESVGAGEPIPVAEMQERQPLGFAALTPAEREYLLNPQPSEQATTEMSWRYEALQLLLWSLGLLELPPPTAICDVAAVAGLVLEADEEQFAATASLRYTPVLLDALDLHYRYHWAVRQAAMEQTDPPGSLEPGVVVERHYALNWLIRFEDAPWDEVDTPT